MLSPGAPFTEMVSLELIMDEYPHQSVFLECDYSFTSIILSMGSASERLQYNVTSFFIGWAYTKYDPCIVLILYGSQARLQLRFEIHK